MTTANRSLLWAQAQQAFHHRAKLNGAACTAHGGPRFVCRDVDRQGPYFSLPGWFKPIHDGHRRPDGRLELTRALAVSCNVYFAQLGVELGPEPFAALASAGLEVDNRRAFDRHGQMIDFRLTARRDSNAAKAFLRKAIDKVRLHRPVTICTDNAPTYRKVVQHENRRYAPQFDSIVHIDKR